MKEGCWTPWISQDRMTEVSEYALFFKKREKSLGLIQIDLLYLDKSLTLESMLERVN